MGTWKDFIEAMLTRK
ncbi:hypothetical protein [Erwinia billingiae]